MSNAAFAFLLTLIAGLSTGIGSVIAFFSKTGNKVFLSFSLGFSAGVMIYVSLVELLSESKNALSIEFGAKTGSLFMLAGFFGGILLIWLIDRLLPDGQNLHNSDGDDTQVLAKTKLMRAGLLTAFAIAVHNLPEGLATFVSALQRPSLAIPIVAAIAIHNIPEGIAVSVPVYHATGSRKKAFIYSLASGITEPLGALAGYLILRPLLNDTVYGMLFAIVAGIMVFISVGELLPASGNCKKPKISIYGFVAGMAVMAVSLWLFMS